MQNSVKQITLLGTLLGTALLVGCSSLSTSKGKITKESFGSTATGQEVTLYTLQNGRGAEAKITDYGGIVVSLKMPDRAGTMGDVVLGYDHLDGYLTNNPYFGCLVGRYGNRIAKGTFTLNGRTYKLATNNVPNHLHGGVKGFDKVIWETTRQQSEDGPSLVMRYVSPNGEEGYPGTLKVTAVYTLTEDNSLRLDYSATTDRATILNLTHHSYFNLAGQGTGDILNHKVMIQADAFTPVDSTLIPTGQLQPVEGTPLDFRTPQTIGARINQANEQLEFGLGYDHNWVISKPKGELGLMARVQEPTTGRSMEVHSTEPGLQFYSGNFLDGTITGKGGNVYQHRNGFCMEPQHYPDSPNKPNFPTVVLNPGEVYENTIIYRFSAQ